MPWGISTPTSQDPFPPCGHCYTYSGAYHRGHSWGHPVLWEKQDKDNHNIQSWSTEMEGHFRNVYSSQVDLINGVKENMRIKSKLPGVLDICKQTIIRRRGPFVWPKAAHLAGGNANSKVRERGSSQIYMPLIPLSKLKSQAYFSLFCVLGVNSNSHFCCF